MIIVAAFLAIVSTVVLVNGVGLVSLVALCSFAIIASVGKAYVAWLEEATDRAQEQALLDEEGERDKMGAKSVPWCAFWGGWWRCLLPVWR